MADTSDVMDLKPSSKYWVDVQLTLTGPPVLFPRAA